MIPNADMIRSKISGWIAVFSGTISCTLMSTNSTTARVRKLREVPTYSTPTDLWSVLVARSTQPGRRRGIASVTTSGRGGATVIDGVTAEAPGSRSG